MKDKDRNILDDDPIIRAITDAYIVIGAALASVIIFCYIFG